VRGQDGNANAAQTTGYFGVKRGEGLVGKPVRVQIPLRHHEDSERESGRRNRKDGRIASEYAATL
jgi:hypothetical protein